MGTKHLTNDDRQRIRTLYSEGNKTKAEIHDITGFSIDQIKIAIKAPSSNVAKRSGRPRVLSREQEELVSFVTSSKEGRRASFFQLSVILFQSLFGVYVIRSTLRRLGFKRYTARRKPPISETNRQKRLAWALEHKDWTPEQWARVLWTDETWITGGHHRKQYVTRRPGEEWDPTCIIERYQRKHGRMFWGCFSGLGKGPGIFWEKDWGSITAETYRSHTIPIIHGWIQLCQQQLGDQLILMQDGAPAHSASGTILDLQERGIQTIQWPPYSPDLNPIEMCWNWMKDYFEDKYGLIEKPSYDRLRIWVKEAWVELPDDYLQSLLQSMPERCMAVIEANGMHTKY
ncbi:transposable element tc1 transposase [Apiospora phragmitis]|uniref:Transposable element tc1 transposase n=1 Tax=Apiospora phragmitis TaxID=2905665 RepID=A0ABR1SV06_9PEZI